MTEIYQLFRSRVFGGHDPYEGFDASAYSLDLQGWGSSDPNFASLIDEIRPRAIIEMGSWKGASAIHMAQLCRQRGLDTAILCVDTWLGAMEFWDDKNDPTRFQSFNLRHGYPQVYYQFLANVVHSGVQDMIVPFPVTSTIAARFCKKYGLHADMLYLDASHDEPDVAVDLIHCWPLIRPGGALFGDDFTSAWPGLCKSVTQFATSSKLPFSTQGRQWMIRRPPISASRAA